MTGETHYALEILAELAEGLLDEPMAREVRSHLAVCDVCGERLAALAGVRELLAATPVPAMPLGVAMRIDRALAAEAASPGPDWDALMADAPWEPAPAAPLRLVSPTRTRTLVKRAKPKPRRRPWMAPVGAVAAATVMAGAVAMSMSLMSDNGSTGSSIAGPVLNVPSGAQTKASPLDRTYIVQASGHNYTSRELNGALLGYFAPGPANGSNDVQLDKCVQRKANELDRAPIAVDRALYNGNEATIMAFWEDKSINAVRVVVVDDTCRNLRAEGLTTWN